MQTTLPICRPLDPGIHCPDCQFPNEGCRNGELVTQTYFDCFSFGLPDNLKRSSEPKMEELTKTVVYENEKDSVDVMIRRKKAEKELKETGKEMQQLANTMAESFYHGKVQRNEFDTINGEYVWIFLMTGHWNGDPTLSTWLKCFVIKKGYQYELLIRFPKDYKPYPAGLLDKLIHSIKVCP